MAEPLITLEEKLSFEASLRQLKQDYYANKINHDEMEYEQVRTTNALYVKIAKRIPEARMQDFINYLIVIVGGKGEHNNIGLEKAFEIADSPDYQQLVSTLSTPQIRRHVHMFLTATKNAPRNFGQTAFVKFLRGQKVANGKFNNKEGYNYFHKDTGWSELQVKDVASVFYSGYDPVSKLFMRYDETAGEKAYKESQKDDSDVPYNAQFAATAKDLNLEFIQKVLEFLESSGLAELSVAEKKAPKERVPKIFKPGDTIGTANISDLPPFSWIEIPVILRRKSGDTNEESTVQIVLENSPLPKHYLGQWRVNPDTNLAYIPKDWRSGFDCDRKCLVGAKFLGIWEKGLAGTTTYAYPYDYIGKKE